MSDLFVWKWTFFGIRNPNFWGGHTSNILYLSNGLRDSQGRCSQKMEFSTFKPLLWSKNFRTMTPQKLRFLMPNKILEEKNFQETPKDEKNSFFHFLGSPDIFFHLQSLIRHQKPQLWGVILTFFDPSNGLKVENSIFWLNLPWKSLKPSASKCSTYDQRHLKRGL